MSIRIWHELRKERYHHIKINNQSSHIHNYHNSDIVIFCILIGRLYTTILFDMKEDNNYNFRSRICLGVSIDVTEKLLVADPIQYIYRGL
jgi:hypothetical protein